MWPSDRRLGQMVDKQVEGVETPAMRMLLEAMGCDAAQGYLFARPLPPDMLAAWLISAGDGDENGAS